MSLNLSLLFLIVISSTSLKDSQMFQAAQAFDDLTKSVTKDDCMNATSNTDISENCCHEVTLPEINDPNSAWRKCLKLAEKKGLDRASELSAKERKGVLWVLVYCYYKRKKYIGPGQTFNMTRIKADAASLPDPFASKFIIEMYENCALKANQTLKEYRHHSPASANDKSFRPRQMFFMLAYSCVNHYSETTACPYFHWAALSEANNSLCQRYVKRCKQLMGEENH